MVRKMHHRLMEQTVDHRQRKDMLLQKKLLPGDTSEGTHYEFVAKQK